MILHEDGYVPMMRLESRRLSIIGESSLMLEPATHEVYDNSSQRTVIFSSGRRLGKSIAFRAYTDTLLHPWTDNLKLTAQMLEGTLRIPHNRAIGCVTCDKAHKQRAAYQFEKKKQARLHKQQVLQAWLLLNVYLSSERIGAQ